MCRLKWPQASQSLLQGEDKYLSRKPNQRSGNSPSRPGDTTKLEKQLPGSLEKVPLWPLILKRLEFLAEQEGLGSVPWAGCPDTLTQVQACCPSAGPEGPGGSPQPCWGQRKEAARCPAHALPPPPVTSKASAHTASSQGEGSNTPTPTQLPSQVHCWAREPGSHLRPLLLNGDG